MNQGTRDIAWQREQWCGGGGRGPRSLEAEVQEKNLTPPSLSHYHLSYSGLCLPDVPPKSQGEDMS